MIILALDTATSACSAALWAHGAIRARRHRVMARGQSETLVPMVAEVMAEAGLDFAALDLIAVTVGPGAFTGIRIGLSTARALGLAAGKKVVGIGTPEAVAAALPKGRPIMVVLDSRREELWVQMFDAQGRETGPVEALMPAEAAARAAGLDIIVAGDAAALVAPLLPQATLIEAHPDAAQVAELAAAGRALPPEPLYLRPADVTIQAG